MKKIAILVPSRSSNGIRNHNIPRLIESWETTTEGMSDFVFGLDEDDAHFYQIPDGHKKMVMSRMTLVPKLNAMAQAAASEYDYLYFMGDDHIFRTKWESPFMEWSSGKPHSVCYGNDLFQGSKLPTAVLMSSSIVNTLGFFTTPVLKHMYADNFWLAVGNHLNCTKYFEDVVIEHLHPIVKKTEYDAQYREVNALSKGDKVEYNKYMQSGFLTDMAKFR